MTGTVNVRLVWRQPNAWLATIWYYITMNNLWGICDKRLRATDTRAQCDLSPPSVLHPISHQSSWADVSYANPLHSSRAGANRCAVSWSSKYYFYSQNYRCGLPDFVHGLNSIQSPVHKLVNIIAVAFSDQTLHVSSSAVVHKLHRIVHVHFIWQAVTIHICIQYIQTVNKSRFLKKNYKLTTMNNFF